MTLQWIRLAVSAACLLIGVIFMVLAVFGVNRFHKALNRMHAAAMGDTLGILFVMSGLIIMKGINMESFKLFLVIFFFWAAGPVSGHMISRLEAMTDENLGKILIIREGRESGYTWEKNPDYTEGKDPGYTEEGKPGHTEGKDPLHTEEKGDAADEDI